MKVTLCIFVVCAFRLACFGQSSEIPRTLPEEAMADSSDLVPWPVKAYPEYAKDSMGNLGSWLLDAPAGKHGFVKVTPQGKLSFEDGTAKQLFLAYRTSGVDRP